MESGTSVKRGRFLFFCVLRSVKTKETNPTRLGSPNPRKQALIERPVVLTRSRRDTAALIAKYVNRASSLFTGAHAFHIRLSHRNSYSVGIFCIDGFHVTSSRR